jgi:hypothetical protein
MMPNYRKKTSSHPHAGISEYQQSMREFREVLEKAGHKISYRINHPRFLEDNQAAKPRRQNRRNR